MKKLVLLVLVVISSSAVGDVYKCKNQSGSILYQGRPCDYNYRDDVTPRDIRDIESNAKEYTGERLTLDFKDIDVRALFELIANFSGNSLKIAGDINRKISIHRIAIPWDQALDEIAKTTGVNAIISNGVIYIGNGNH